jgi:hypothetical protein
MAHTVWFIPTNSSHIGKLRAFMDALHARGHQVHLACLDALLETVHATRRQMEQAGYPFEVLPGGWLGGKTGLLELLRPPGVSRIARQFLQTHPADALVFGADTGVVSRNFIRAAERMGVPTVLVPDGLVLPPNPRHKGPVGWEVRRSKFSAALLMAFGAMGRRGESGVRQILVMGEKGRRTLVDRGVPAERIRRVGWCEYDGLVARAAEGLTTADEATLRQRVGLPADRPVVLLVHQDDLGIENSYDIVSRILAGARRGGACVLVKFHPRNPRNMEVWHAWARSQNIGPDEVIFVRNECTSLEAARLCTVCVAAYSTVALEALLYRRPLVLIQYLHLPMELAYGRDYDAALEVERPEDLEGAVHAALTDEAVRQRLSRNAWPALEQEIGPLDGKAAERMVDAVLELIESAPRAKKA